MIGHNSNDTDGYKRPVFSFGNKLRRVFWKMCWLLLCRWTPNPLFGWRSFVLRMFGATIGKNNFIYPNCSIWAPWFLETENVVTIGPNVEVYNPAGIYLGHHSVLSQGAYLCGATHDYNTPDFTFIAKKIIVEPYVWICAKSVVLPGVHCGEGSVLGAAAVTAKDMEPWSVYSGNPAIKVKTRNKYSF